MEIASLRRVGNVSVITLTGRMNHDGIDDVDAHINRAAISRGVTGVHFNAARVTSITDAGYRTLIHARRTAKRHGLDFLLGVSHDRPVARSSPLDQTGSQNGECRDVTRSAGTPLGTVVGTVVTTARRWGLASGVTSCSYPSEPRGMPFTTLGVRS